MSQHKATSRGYTADRYLAMLANGELRPDDRVELLDGLIVAEPPQDPPHASAITRVHGALHRVIRDRAVIRVQLPFIAGRSSVPEPDVAVVPGQPADYDGQHPTTALLVVEVASTSLPQDRLSKSRIYAGAGCPEYWVLNLRDDCVEIFREPDVDSQQYEKHSVARRGDRIDLLAFPDASVSTEELLPGRLNQR